MYLILLCFFADVVVIVNVTVVVGVVVVYDVVVVVVIETPSLIQS